MNSNGTIEASGASPNTNIANCEYFEKYSKDDSKVVCMGGVLFCASRNCPHQSENKYGTENTEPPLGICSARSSKGIEDLVKMGILISPATIEQKSAVA